MFTKQNHIYSPEYYSDVCTSVFWPPNPGYVTEKGREFIIAFVENRILVDYPIIKLYATSVSEIPVNVTFSVPLMTDEFADETLELEPGQAAVKEYPYELHMLDDGVDYKGKNLSIVLHSKCRICQNSQHEH